MSSPFGEEFFECWRSVPSRSNCNCRLLLLAVHHGPEGGSEDGSCSLLGIEARGASGCIVTESTSAARGNVRKQLRIHGMRRRGVKG